MAKKPDLKLVEEADDNSDGRRQRSARSKGKIVEAMLALIREGETHPSAASVAEKAGVSLRTVFRHFDEMDSLYREMTDIIADEILPILMKPYGASDWQGQMRELGARRAEVYETIMPIRIAASARRFRSDYLMDDYLRFLALERSGLKAVLPKKVADRKKRFAALEMVTGFQTWRRLRQDQGLSVVDATAVMQDTVERLIADF